MDKFNLLKHRLLLIVIVLLSAHFASAQTSIPDSEHQALLAIRTALNGDKWYDSWDVNQTPDKWKGVTIENGHVTLLNLKGNNLLGALPADIAKLTELEMLDLSLNSITSLPAELFKMSKLISLDVRSQKNYAIGGSSTKSLIGALPNEISMSNLEYLLLQDNALSGELPKVVNLPKCAHIYLQNNELTGTIPSNWLTLPKTQFLLLGNNKFSGNVTLDFTGLPALIQFSIENNTDLTGTFPKGIENCPALQLLNLQATGLSGTLPTEGWDKLEHFTYLQLTQCKFNGSIPAEIATCKSLQELKLSYNNFTGEIPDLTLLKNLAILELSGNKLGGEIPVWLSELPRLMNISMANMNLSGTIPAALGSELEELTYIDFTHNQLTGSIPETFKAKRSMTDLLLGENKLTGNIDVVKTMTGLRNLKLNDNQLEGEIGDILDRTTLTYLKSAHLQNNNFTGNVTKKVYNRGNSAFIGFKKGEVNISGNQFNFKSFENLCDCITQGKDAGYMVYNAMKPYTEDSVIMAEGSEEITLNANCPSPENVGGRFASNQVIANQYQWYVNDAPIAGATSETYVIPNTTSAHGKVYTCKVKNNIAPMLTLTSGKFIMNVPATINEVAKSNAELINNNGVVSCKGASHIIIYNIDGSRVAATNGEMLDASTLNKGLYIVTAQVDGQTISRKVVF